MENATEHIPHRTTDAPPITGSAVGGARAGPPPAGAWGSVQTTLSVHDVLERARGLSRRGKLPGFVPGVNGTPSDTLFSFAAFGAPLDYVVAARVGSSVGHTALSFEPRMHRRLPIIMAVVTVVSIWPGLPITDSLIKSYFPSYAFSTWMWYLPLTILPLPFMFMRMWKQSARAAHEHALETIEVLRTTLTLGPPPA